MLTCQGCGAHISRLDAEGAASSAGDGQQTLCPSCAVELHYAAVDAANVDDHSQEEEP
jgi:hypothetical protein